MSFDSFESVLLRHQGMYLALGIHVLHDLMQSRWHDVIPVDAWPSEQKVVRSVHIYDIDRHLCLEISDLAAEFELPHWLDTIGIEPKDIGASGTQSMGRNRQVLHDTSWHDAERGAWVHLDARDLCGTYIPREI